MASASTSSSTCIPRRDLFSYPIQTQRRCLKFSFRETTDFTTSCSPLPSNLSFYGRTAHRLSGLKEKNLGYAWKYYAQIPRKWIFKEWSLEKHQAHPIKAVAMVEPQCLLPSGNSERCDSKLQFDSHSGAQVLNSSTDDTSELDEKEKLRRTRISKANKGCVPWNKGRKHSAETLRRIREGTKIAMQNPKVKMKLMNLGHAQSEETKIKIAVGVREGWQRRRELLMVQEGCIFEWKNIIAEASKNGYGTEDELEWDSHEILDQQLKQEWSAHIKMKKEMPRPKGNKRAPKSPEQRKRISDAINAKWADPAYRERVYSALSKYHGVPVGGGKKSRKKATGEAPSAKKETVKKTTKNVDVKKTPPRRKRNANPTYIDPMASSKLEMIKKIRAERTTLETKKKEATARAKLLIAEAEKAAKALEVAAQKSSLAQASLLETRMLIAEATRSIESIERGELTPQDTGQEASFSTNGPLNHFKTTPKAANSTKVFDKRLVNGSNLLPSDENRGFAFDRLTLQNALNAGESLPSARKGEGPEVVHGYPSPFLLPNNVEISALKDLEVTYSNGSIQHKDLPPERKVAGSSESDVGKRTTSCELKTKKWVRGRLVEVED